MFMNMKKKQKDLIIKSVGMKYDALYQFYLKTGQYLKASYIINEKILEIARLKAL